METTKEVEKDKCRSVWKTIVVILLWLFVLTFWVQYESTQYEGKQKENLKEIKDIKEIILATSNSLCECPKPKAKVSRKKAKPKAKTSPKKEMKPIQPPVVPEPTFVSPPKPKVEMVTESQKEDFYDNAEMPKTWVTEPEKEVVKVEPARVGRKIIVIREQPPMQYYGGYSSGYYPSYAPQVTYGQQYIAPPQQVFVPAPPVIVPAPSVVTPAGGYAPRGTTGGRSPSGVTGGAR